MKKLLHIFLGLILSLQTFGQIRLEVTKYAKLLLPNGQIFVAGDFNNWNPGDPNFQLKRRDDGVYFIDLPDTLRNFEYKFTQGSWTFVEGSAGGGSRMNRIFHRKDEGNTKLIQAEILDWEKKPTYSFVIKSIPENTPHDATLYISGNFNNWNASDELYKLQKQMDGTYHVQIYTELNELEYKFTRGTWASVEGQESGKARPNRKFFRKSLDDNRLIDIEIVSWEDLSSTFNFYSIYDLLLLFSVFQGILLIIAIPTIQDYNRIANRWLVILIGFASVMLFLRVVGNYREVAQSYSKILLLPDFLLFLYAPLFYFYVQKLLFQSENLPAKWYWHFVPTVILLFVYLPYFLMNNKIFQLKIVNREADLSMIFFVMGVLALLFNAYYWWICRKSINIYKKQYGSQHSYEQNLQYLSTISIIQAFCLGLWFFTFLLAVSSKIFAIDVANITEKSIDGIWLAFSTITYFLGYFAIHQPEIFKLPEPVPFFGENELLPIAEKSHDLPKKEIDSPHFLDENLQVLKEKIEVFMLKNKPYTNPQLTLNDLANKLKIQPHILSKVINDGFEKNFFDFVNTYRIEEFKQRMEDPRYKNFTLLGIAFEVGFNSKTAFNRSFKKITDQTPREYFNLVKN